MISAKLVINHEAIDDFNKYLDEHKRLTGDMPAVTALSMAKFITQCVHVEITETPCRRRPAFSYNRFECFGCGRVIPTERHPSGHQLIYSWQINALAREGIENTLCGSCASQWKNVTDAQWKSIARLCSIQYDRGFRDCEVEHVDAPPSP